MRVFCGSPVLQTQLQKCQQPLQSVGGGVPGILSKQNCLPSLECSMSCCIWQLGPPALYSQYQLKWKDQKCSALHCSNRCSCFICLHGIQTSSRQKHQKKKPIYRGKMRCPATCHLSGRVRASIPLGMCLDLPHRLHCTKTDQCCGTAAALRRLHKCFSLAGSCCKFSPDLATSLQAQCKTVQASGIYSLVAELESRLTNFFLSLSRGRSRNGMGGGCALEACISWQYDTSSWGSSNSSLQPSLLGTCPWKWKDSVAACCK